MDTDLPLPVVDYKFHPKFKLQYVYCMSYLLTAIG